MGRLIYSMICSADGYVADEEGRFDDWARPDEQVLETINQDMSDVGTYLYWRRMYEMMTVWETDPDLAADSPESEVFARDWQAKEKIVYSTTLPEVVTRGRGWSGRLTPKKSVRSRRPRTRTSPWTAPPWRPRCCG